MAEKHETDGGEQTPVTGKPEPLGKGTAAGGDQVQEKVDAETEKGYHGTVPPDDTDYSVAGQLAAEQKAGYVGSRTNITTNK